MRSFGTRIAFVSLILLLSIQSGLGLSAYPQPWTQTSSIATVDDAVEKMYLSQPYESTVAKAEIAADLIAVEHNAMQAFLRRATPASRKHIVLVRYEVEDRRIVQALIDARTAGFAEVRLVTDLNVSLHAVSYGEHHYTSDFAAARYGTGGIAAATRTLRTNDQFVYATADRNPVYAIYSHPLYDHAHFTEMDIMHEKELYLYEDDDQGRITYLQFYNGTANMSDNPRYNRILKVNDPNAAAYGLLHARGMMEVFRHGGRINAIHANFPNVGVTYREGEGTRFKRIEFLDRRFVKTTYQQDGRTVDTTVQTNPGHFGPLRIIYRDGSFQEMAFTDGDINPNDRIPTLLSRSLGANPAVTIREDEANERNGVIFSQFVLTHGATVEALRRAMMGKSFNVYGLFEDKFIDAQGWGQAAALVGIPVFRPPMMGRLEEPVFPFRSELRGRRMTLFGYLRGVAGRQETTLEGAPTARTLQHDKTTIVSVREQMPAIAGSTATLKNLIYVFTGSFNLSNHDASAELSTMYQFPADAPVAKAFKESVIKVVDLQSQPQAGGIDPYATPLAQAVLRDALGHLTGRGPLQIPIATVRAVANAVARAEPNYDAMVTAILSLRDIRSVLIRTAQEARLLNTPDLPVSNDEIQRRADKVKAFCQWYDALPEAQRLTTGEPLAKVITAATLLSYTRRENAAFRAQKLETFLSRRQLPRPPHAPAGAPERPISEEERQERQFEISGDALNRLVTAGAEALGVSL